MKSLAFILLTVFAAAVLADEKPKFEANSIEEKIDGSVRMAYPHFLWKGDKYYVVAEEKSWLGACRLAGRSKQAKLVAYDVSSPAVYLDIHGRITEQAGPKPGAIVAYVDCW
jgi:hypothetical protein